MTSDCTFSDEAHEDKERKLDERMRDFKSRNHDIDWTIDRFERESINLEWFERERPMY